jgi:BirA family biotin operon repressor/biotin-[acetyl-CoA-carboxylase] ligase
VVVGVGVNVNWPATLPSELAGIAVACNHLAGREVDREGVLQCFLERLEQRYRRLVTGGDRGGLLDEWRARSATIGQHVRVELGQGRVVGTAVDVDDRGHLVVETDDGTRRSFAAGDVVHLRPA